jgi:hypothetical protein
LSSFLDALRLVSCLRDKSSFKDDLFKKILIIIIKTFSEINIVKYFLALFKEANGGNHIHEILDLLHHKKEPKPEPEQVIHEHHHHHWPEGQEWPEPQKEQAWPEKHHDGWQSWQEG